MDQNLDDSKSLAHPHEPARWWFQISIPFEVCLKSTLLDTLYNPQFGDFPKSCKAVELNEILVGIQEKVTHSFNHQSDILAKNVEPSSLVDTKPIIARLDVMAISLLILEKSKLKPKLLSIVKESKDDSIIDQYLNMTSSIMAVLGLKARILSASLTLHEDEFLTYKKMLVDILRRLSYGDFEYFNSLFNDDGEDLTSFDGLKLELLEEKQKHLRNLKMHDQGYFLFTTFPNSSESLDAITRQSLEVEKILESVKEALKRKVLTKMEDDITDQSSNENRQLPIQQQDSHTKDKCQTDQSSNPNQKIPIQVKDKRQTDQSSNQNHKLPIQQQDSQVKDKRQTDQSSNQNHKLPIQQQGSYTKDKRQTDQSSNQNHKLSIQQQDSHIKDKDQTDQSSNQSHKLPIQQQDSYTKDKDQTDQSPNQNHKLPIQQQDSHTKDTDQTDQSSNQNHKLPIQQQDSHTKDTDQTDQSSNQSHKLSIQQQDSHTKDKDQTDQSSNQNHKLPIQQQDSHTKDTDQTDQSSNQNHKLPIQQQGSHTKDKDQTDQSSNQNHKLPIQKQPPNTATKSPMLSPHQNKFDISKKSQQLKRETKERYNTIDTPYHSGVSNLHAPISSKRDEIIVDLSIISSDTFAGIHSQSDIGRVQTRDESKVVIGYDDIITNSNDYVIISGVPGSGKTTLAETLLYSWSCEGLWHNTAQVDSQEKGVKKKVHFDFVFVLYFRQLVRFRKDNTITAEKLLDFFYPNYGFNDGALLKELKKYDRKALIVLEGFDEFANKRDFVDQPEEEWSSLSRSIHDLMNPENPTFDGILTRVVSSRPGSCSLLMDTFFPRSSRHKHWRKIIEVTGFNKQNIDLYIQKHVRDDQKVKQVQEKIDDSQMLGKMIAIPFYAWGICYLLNSTDNTEGISVHTYTSLFCNLLPLFLRSHSATRKNQFGCSTRNILEDPKVHQELLTLAKMAFQLEVEGKIAFTSEEIISGELSMKEVLDDTGLIIEIDYPDSIEGTRYQFLHYSFNEFLTALHLFDTGTVDARITNPYILSMLSGLVGGSLYDSQSSPIVRKFTSIFTKSSTESRKELLVDHLLAKEPKNPQHFFIDGKAYYLSVFYEYQNKIEYNEHLHIQITNGSLNNYEKQCLDYLEKQATKGMFRLKSVTLSSFKCPLESDEAKRLHSLFMLHTKNVNVSFNNIIQVSQLAEVIKDHVIHLKPDFKIQRLFFLTLPNTDMSKAAPILPFVHGLETNGYLSQLRQLCTAASVKLREGQPAPYRLTYHSPFSLTAEELIECGLNIFQEIILAYNPYIQHMGAYKHQHARDCIAFESWKKMRLMSVKIWCDLQTSTSAISEQLEQKIKRIGASCMRGYLYEGEPTIFDHSDEIENISMRKPRETYIRMPPGVRSLKDYLRLGVESQSQDP